MNRKADIVIRHNKQSIRVLFIVIWGLRPTLVKLDVPMFGQSTPYYCVPTCIKMVLEYARKKYGERIPRYPIKKIARIVKTNTDGTRWKDIENMNEVLSKADLSVEFNTKFFGHFPEIINELGEENRRPVIVMINCVEPPDTIWHAVVITGFDPEKNTVFFNDPNGSVEKMEEVGMFIKKWGVRARLAKVLIRKRHQKRISAWVNKTKNEEELSE